MRHNGGGKRMMIMPGVPDKLKPMMKYYPAKIEKNEITSNDITEDLISNSLYTGGIPDPDLLIRTSGEYRVSNFLLWQIAYTEIYITPTLWPDFNKDEYLAAIKDFQKRDRRFGGT